MKIIYFILTIAFTSSCTKSSESDRVRNEWGKLLNQNGRKHSVLESNPSAAGPLQHGQTMTNSGPQPGRTGMRKGAQVREQLVGFARSYMGTPYLYGAMDPQTGFDCSGFINFVFNHYKYKVPRSSKDFFHFGRQIEINKVQKGDLVIFTGTEPNSQEVGHIGIVLAARGMDSQFIHSSSGKANGVTISSLSEPHYAKRLVKAISVID
ncbi:MAG: C40 family peptidase [Weeksellaceae bacterium]|nr:C40 family peptidase [Weeksellaceae bacterium]